MLAIHPASGARKIVPCADCAGEGFVRHCVACQGSGQLDAGELAPAMIDCPECSGKGYPQPKRFHFLT
jgi:hypothetical protein